MQLDPLNTFLASLGWDGFFQSNFTKINQPGHFPGRVVSQGKGHYHVLVAPETILEASITNKLRHSTSTPLDYPGVGDWVCLSRDRGSTTATIQSLLPRKSLVQRKRGGASKEAQLIVTNVDFVFIVTSLNEDFDLERLGRYADLCTGSGATAVLLLTKADLCKDIDSSIHQIRTKMSGMELFKISKFDTRSIEPLQKFFSPGMTSVLLGSSGVGKSTLTNYLIGKEFQKTQDLSSEDKGRHTTTSRNLFFTHWGGLVIDTPGMQEISAQEINNKTQKQFLDIEELMLRCKFTNCRHCNDPGCAITSGLKKGTLSAERWNEFILETTNRSR